MNNINNLLNCFALPFLALHCIYDNAIPFNQRTVAISKLLRSVHNFLSTLKSTFLKAYKMCSAFLHQIEWFCIVKEVIFCISHWILRNFPICSATVIRA